MFSIEIPIIIPNGYILKNILDTKSFEEANNLRLIFKKILHLYYNNYEKILNSKN